MADNQGFMQELREVFDLCDEGQRGFISVDKLKEILQKHLEVGEQEIQQLIQCLDPDGDNVVTFPDFYKGVTSVMRSEGNARQDLMQGDLVSVQNDEDILDENRGLVMKLDRYDNPVIVTDFSDSRTPTEDEENYEFINSEDDFESDHATIPTLRPCKLSSSNIASQLLRSSSCENNKSSITSLDPNDMYSDQQLLEEDVNNLNQKIEMLEEQMSVMSESQNFTEDKYTRVKQENTVLISRLHNLEEHIRELEIKSEGQLERDQKLKDVMELQEREQNKEMDQYINRLCTLQQEYMQLKEERVYLKSQLEKLKQEKQHLQAQLSDSALELSTLREEHQYLQEVVFREREESLQERKASSRIIQELHHELTELRQYRHDTETLRARSPSLLELPAQYNELEKELQKLKRENKALEEANEELQAQLLSSSIQEGRSLLHQETATSLAEEFASLSKDEVMDALQEQQDVNMKLRSYIDGILLNIMENYPQLLEVRNS